MNRSAVITIDRPQRYGKQLAAHLGHRSEVTETADGWSLVMTGGTATITVGTETLTLSVSAESAESIETLMNVLERHLRKFAAKEEDLEIVWQTTP